MEGGPYHRAVPGETTPHPLSVLVDLDGALGDTRPLWNDWLRGAARTLPVDATALPADRAAAAEILDQAGAGNWRVLLERFAEERAPVYLRPAAEVGAALRRLVDAGTAVGVFTDAPEELTRVALAQLGAGRRVTAVEAGRDALVRLQARLGPHAVIARTREELIRTASYTP
jgi:phosphoglycolate phosphatase-like HAD superfamily hydrolase